MRGGLHGGSRLVVLGKLWDNGRGKFWVGEILGGRIPYWFRSARGTGFGPMMAVVIGGVARLSDNRKGTSSSGRKGSITIFFFVS